MCLKANRVGNISSKKMSNINYQLIANCSVHLITKKVMLVKTYNFKNV